MALIVLLLSKKMFEQSRDAILLSQIGEASAENHSEYSSLYKKYFLGNANS